MATKSTSSARGDSSEMQAAAVLIIQQEEMRQAEAEKRAKRRGRKRVREERRAVEKMHQSIEVMKWCIVGICAVWVISFLISIVVLFKVQHRVAEIEGQVVRIREVMDNPFATLGARMGGEADEKLKVLLGLSGSKDEGE